MTVGPIDRRPLSQVAAAAPFTGNAVPVLIVPGIDNSGPAHWQTLWENGLPEAERVEQADWARPRLADWTASLAEAIRDRPGAVLVAHSLGCALVAHLLNITGGRGVAAALLVAPADVDDSGRTRRLAPDFAPMPRAAFPVPTIVAASRDDPFVSFGRAQAFAGHWGARFVDLGHAGHVNVDSGHGPWPEGRALFDDLVRGCGAFDGLSGEHAD